MIILLHFIFVIGLILYKFLRYYKPQMKRARRSSHNIHATESLITAFARITYEMTAANGKLTRTEYEYAMGNAKVFLSSELEITLFRKIYTKNVGRRLSQNIQSSIETIYDIATKKEGINFAAYLYGLMTADNTKSNEELRLLKDVIKRLGLDEEEVKEKIRTEKAKEKKREEERQEETRKRTTPKAYLSTQMYDTLGVTSEATNDQIKKAYRNMVKLHHPDRYANSSAEMQKAAEDSFRRIQEAYEKISAERGIR